MDRKYSSDSDIIMSTSVAVISGGDRRLRTH